MMNTNKARALTVIGAAVAVAALGAGTADAAGLIGGGQIKSNAIVSRHLHSDSVGTSELRNGSVHGADLADHTISMDKLGLKLQKALGKAGVPGAPGAPGEPGDKGDKGDKGDPGVSGVHADGPYAAGLPGQNSSETSVPAGETKVVWTACKSGEAALGGGFRLNGLAAEAFQGGGNPTTGIDLIASEPAYAQGDSLVNGSEVAPVNDNLSFSPNAWAVTVHNNGESAAAVRAWAVCATVGQ